VIDPHFWMDPVLSMQVSLAIAARLSSLDLEYSEVYVKNALEIAQRLGALHDELSKLLEPYRGSAVVQHHPSMNYFFNRYGIRSLGAIEMAAGREPTPRELERLAQTMRLEGVKVVITEPQLPRDAVAAVAQMTGATIVEMDPIGGVPGRETYEELLRFNARSLADALE
jgi:ABC-type Zn uptake system ZnuABC Zn-binding protein ZnuA